MGTYIKDNKGKKHVDSLLKNHGLFRDSGPMWLGSLWDNKLASLIEKNNSFEENNKILSIIKNESKIDVVGFYDITKLSKKYKIHQLPKQEDIIKAIKKKGFKASLTHFRENSIRTNISEGELVKIIKGL